jgi:hypothetical protein
MPGRDAPFVVAIDHSHRQAAADRGAAVRRRACVGSFMSSAKATWCRRLQPRSAQAGSSKSSPAIISATIPEASSVYFIIGVICAVVNVAAFSILFHGRLSVEMATPASFAISTALNYVLCIAILFHHKARWNTFANSPPIYAASCSWGSSITA